LPTLTRLVDLSRVALGGEPWPRQRTLDALGLDGLSPAEIRTVVASGRTSAPGAVAPAGPPLAWGGLVAKI
jgi:hypothetical protein